MGKILSSMQSRDWPKYLSHSFFQEEELNKHAARIGSVKGETLTVESLVPAK
jgi:hypothetical protein